MSTDNLLLDTIFESVLEFMEDVEKQNLLRDDKRNIVLDMMREKFEDVYEVNEDTINTAIETIIFLSKLRRKIKINEISKHCSDCFGFIR
jgi:hypothetical protein